VFSLSQASSELRICGGGAGSVFIHSDSIDKQQAPAPAAAIADFSSHPFIQPLTQHRHCFSLQFYFLFSSPFSSCESFYVMLKIEHHCEYMRET
jgi:hypothetical protein